MAACGFQRSAQLGDGRRQALICAECAIPHRVNEVITGNNLSGMLGKDGQELSNPRLQPRFGLSAITAITNRTFDDIPREIDDHTRQTLPLGGRRCQTGPGIVGFAIFGFIR